MIRSRLATQRLTLRLFTADDVQAMYDLNSDPEVTRYAEAAPVSNLQEAREKLEAGPLADYEKYGYGRFAVEFGETGKVIGFCGIKYIPEIGLPEIGYRFMKMYWGRGLCTEAARACVDFAREDLKIGKLVALIMPENTASIRVAEKLGMRQGPLIEIYGVEALQYELQLNGG
jgi:ribosomal-protein-alanine N-acetyltransferase